MVKDTPFNESSYHRFITCRLLTCLVFLITVVPAVQAITLKEYHAQVKQAVVALDSLAQADETESAWDYGTRSAETTHAVRELLPAKQDVVWNGATFNVDNTWLHYELDKYGNAKYDERLPVLRRITERLQAIAERIAELESPGSSSGDKAERSRKLAEILKRAEFARKAKEKSAISNLVERFIKWFQDLFPKPKPSVTGKRRNL